MKIEEKPGVTKLTEAENLKSHTATAILTEPYPVGRRQAFAKGIGLTLVLGLGAMLLAPVPGLSVLGSLTIALLLGIGWRAVAGLAPSSLPGVQFSARKLLRGAIILTGVRLNFGLIASSGPKVLLLDLLLIIFGILFIPWLGSKLGLRSGLALLIGVGQSICGASAVGAAASLIKEADDQDTSLAVAICGLVGTLGVVIFTGTNQLFHWPSSLYALVTGSTLHEIAQVAAAGPAAGVAAADLSLVVKLTRVVLLAPVMLILAVVFAWKAEKKAEEGQKKGFDWKKVPVPWFVFGFLLVGVVNSTRLVPKEITDLVLQGATFLFVMAMAGMGLMVDLVVIRKTGLRSLGVAVLAFAIFVGTSFFLIGILGM